MDSNKTVWLANEIFAAFPKHVTGIKFYILDCGCIYYQRIFEEGGLDPKVGIYRDAASGLCEICMSQDKNWNDRVIDETMVYSGKFQVACQ